MRVIAGKYKGLSLFSKKSSYLRPTQDKVKEAIFNIIAPNIVENTFFLDLFCGTGAIGIEALSRGIKLVTFVDKTLSLCKKNLAKIPERQQMYQMDVVKFLNIKHRQKYAIIYLDPPWTQEELYPITLNGIIKSDILQPTNSMIIVEHYKKLNIPSILPNINFKIYNYGDTSLTIFRL